MLPSIIQNISEQPVLTPPIREKSPPKVIETNISSKLVVPIGQVGPTSPELVSVS